MGGAHAGDPCTFDADCLPGGACTGNCPPPQTQGGDFNADYRWDRTNWSSLQANGRNPGLTSEWDFETGRQGYTVGLNNTTTRPLSETVANWGEDKNFDGHLNWYCSTLQALACYNGNLTIGNGCGRCSNNPSQGCPVGHAEQCTGGGTCTPDGTLGNCISDEDRDPPNGALDDNWSTLGGCGWQTNDDGQPGSAAAWHTGQQPGSSVPGLGRAGCLPELRDPDGNREREARVGILRSPIFEKVNRCVGRAQRSVRGTPHAPNDPDRSRDTGAAPAGAVRGTSDTQTSKVFKWSSRTGRGTGDGI